MGERTTELPRAISRCSLNSGYHSHKAGPCFDTVEQAVTYRDRQERERTEEFTRRAAREPRFAQHYAEAGWPDAAWNPDRPAPAGGDRGAKQ